MINKQAKEIGSFIKSNPKKIQMQSKYLTVSTEKVSSHKRRADPLRLAPLLKRAVAEGWASWSICIRVFSHCTGWVGAPYLREGLALQTAALLGVIISTCPSTLVFRTQQTSNRFQCLFGIISLTLEYVAGKSKCCCCLCSRVAPSYSEVFDLFSNAVFGLT